MLIETQKGQLIHKKDNQDTKRTIGTLRSVMISIYGQMLALVIEIEGKYRGNIFFIYGSGGLHTNVHVDIRMQTLLHTDPRWRSNIVGVLCYRSFIRRLKDIKIVYYLVKSTNILSSNVQ